MKIPIKSLQHVNGILIIEPTDNTKELLTKLQTDFTSSKKAWECEIGQKKEKRSLNANNFAWHLITEIANVLRSSKEEVYFQMLKRYGQSQVVSVVKEGVEILKRSVKYCEEWQESTLNGKEFIHIKIYTGSSEFTSNEMSIFIDSIVSEAKELNIETLTFDEIAKLKSTWG